MNQHLQKILDLIEQSQHLDAEEKEALLTSAKNADKELDIVTFKLDRTEKVKRTTAILLEETIEELEQKRKAVEAQNRELETESSLERVRTVALSMNKRDDMLSVCRMISGQLELLNVKDIRNVQTAIFYEGKGTYSNFEYYAFHDKSLVTEVEYKNHPMSAAFAREMLSGPGKFFTQSLQGKELKDWYAFQQTTNQFADTHLEVASSLNYYWFSLGPVALGISTYAPLKEPEIELFRRFRNVFELAYRRFMDIEKAEALAREAEIELGLERIRAKTMAMQKQDDLLEVTDVFLEQLLHLGFDVETVSFSDGLSVKDWDIWLTTPAGETGRKTDKLLIPWFSHPYFKTVKKALDKYFKEGTDLNVSVFNKKDKDSFLDHLFAKTSYADFPREAKDFFYSRPGFTWSTIYLKETWVAICKYDTKPFTEEQNAILRRFANTFGQTYTRFLDLKKAEAQAREARIEAALERARTQSMIMQHSTELDDTLRVFHEQVLVLGIPSAFSFLWLPDEEKERHLFWAAWAEDHSTKSKAINYPLDRNDLATAQCLVDWKGKEPVVSYHVPPAAVENYFAAWQELIDGVEQLNPGHFAGGLYYVEAFMKYGCFGVMVKNGLTEDEKKVLLRFSIEFERAYTRFLDLQKAEAQAREAQIQLALERVRAKTMAMQKSGELRDVVHSVYERLNELNIELNTVFIIVFIENSRDTEWWLVNNRDQEYLKVFVKYADISYYRMLQNARENTEGFFSVLFSREEKNELLNYLFEQTDFRYTPGDQKERLLATEAGAFSVALTRNIAIHLTRYSKKIFTNEENDVLRRITKVFDQAYTRFLDLQKAEAQAREAQIEAALERVRSRTMAMHKSEELKEVIRVVLEQFIHLRINVGHAGFYIDYKANDDMHIWLADPNIDPFYAILPYFDSPTWKSFLDAKAKGRNFYTDLLDFKEKNKFYTSLFKLFTVPEEAKKFYLQCKGLAISTVLLDNVGLYIENFDAIPYTDDENNILKRFAKVFEQTYTRFLDLQKAEAQAREAKIEAALEKVRSRTNAMYHSDNLHDVIHEVYAQLRQLGFRFDSADFMTDHSSAGYNIWLANGEKNVPSKIYVPAIEHRVFRLLKETVGRGDHFFTFLLNREEKNAYFKNVFENTAVKDILADQKQVIYAAEGMATSCVVLKNIILSVTNFASIPYTDAENDIIRRFAYVFEQSYTRFLDLQKAEAQAREAQVEAALERVRSRTLAMQKSDELAETAAVLFQQLISLGIEPNRLYIAVIKNEDGNSEFWITDEDGARVSTAFRANMSDNSTLLKMFEGWKQQQRSLIIDMHGEELQSYFRYLTGLGVPFKGGLEQKRRIQEIAYFSKGFIGMASPEEQPAETLLLLERFAAVFNLTFTRFNDLKVAEAHALQAEQDLAAIKEAKQNAEEALAELQTTQKQLIQSEKMASLGELTAGIAHEIQNPLNFVNNFSEVSKELLDEMKDEWEKGNMEDAKEIMQDVIQNLEKISHHGKRADGIVKGMLQHSRTSSGQKEPTDINGLCDEYVRLAYHGLRAKDKSFNAKFETDLDASVGRIEVMPQDMGRVILNLINNAFYAVTERKKRNETGYEPVVSVRTKKTKDHIDIRVKDNGTGIPQRLLDKIFQPFFTTKPTGQGTGLGLSLSYDIVKAHGGELKVETKEGEGTVFIIELPVV